MRTQLSHAYLALARLSYLLGYLDFRLVLFVIV